jgi:HSP20 family molecular chaperone IbpA
MATPKQASTSKSAVTTTPRFVHKDEAEALQQTIQDRISARAYQLYEESGYQQGHDQGHWFQAESEVVQGGLEVRESGTWVAVNASLPNVSAEHVQIYVDRRRIVVRATKNNETRDAKPAAPGQAEIFLVADLTEEVEPATASASLKDEKLSLMVKKCFPASVGPIRFADRR